MDDFFYRDRNVVQSDLFLVMSTSDWVRYEDLKAALNNIKYIEFSEKWNRDQARSKMVALRVPVPFRSTRRFPMGQRFVHMDNFSISALMSQIINSLDVPTRFVEKGMLSSEDVARWIASFNDTKFAFHQGITSLINTLNNITSFSANGIYNCESFEKLFGIPPEVPVQQQAQDQDQ